VVSAAGPPQGAATVTIRRRACAGETAPLVAAGLSPLFARLYGARGVVTADETRTALAGMPPPE